MQDEEQSIKEFLDSLPAEAAEQDAFEQELLQEEIEVTAHPHTDGTAPFAEDVSKGPSPDREVSSRTFCTKCGNEIKLGKGFCSNCGAPVNRK